MATTTYEALTEWLELIHDISPRWVDLMDEAWADLPPDVTRCLLDASRAFADSSDALMEHLQETSENDN